MIENVFKKSKQDQIFSEVDFAQFIKEFYLKIEAISLKEVDKKVKNLTFKDIFNEDVTEYEGD